MPLPRSAARRVNRQDEVLPLLGWNGGAEDAARGDVWSSRSVTCIAQRAPRNLLNNPCCRRGWGLCGVRRLNSVRFWFWDGRGL